MNGNVYIESAAAQMPGRTRHPSGSAWQHGDASRVAEFQRSRLLKAALEVVSEHGYQATSATTVVARAHVSRKTFYEVFRSYEDCYMAVIEDSLAQVERVVLPAYMSKSGWSERLRAALVALLAFLEREREIGTFVLSYVVGQGPSRPEPRTRIHERLRGVVEEGHSVGRSRRDVLPLSGELVVGGVTAVLHRHLKAGSRDLGELVNPLMWMIVLPYLGPAAAARELKRPVPGQVEWVRNARRAPLRTFNLRLTYRTARALEVIANAPGMSNVEISGQVGISDQGQMSKLLGRLANRGLIENVGAGQTRGAANAWHLTGSGSDLELAIRRKTAIGERLSAHEYPRAEPG
jgi:AcrR family transcriptional regulator